MPLIFVKVFLGRLLDALKWCLERPAIALAVASLVVAAFYYVKADHLTEKLENARAEITQMANERRAAVEYANAEKKRIEAERKRIADEADKKLRIALNDADARLRAYAKAHRANLSGAPAVAEVDNGPDPEAIVVTIGDARICTINTVRLIETQRWANETWGNK